MTRLIPELQGTGPDGQVQTGDDFTKKVKRTLGDYLNSQVNSPEVGNKNTPEREYADQEDVGLHENTTVFNRLDVDAFQELREFLDENIESGINTEDILKAIDGSVGGETPTDDADLQSQPAGKKLVGAVSKVLRTNRFQASSTFSDQFDDDGQIAAMPTGLGHYDQNGAPATLEDLKKVGLSLALRATGEFINGDPTTPGVSLASLLPGQAQLGARIDSSTMYAENVFGAPGTDPSGPIRTRLIDILRDKAQPSYGQLNSPNEPFAGFLPIGMTGLAIALVVALRLITTALVRLIGIIAGKPFGPGTGKISTDPLTYGQYGRQTTSNPLIPISLADIGIIELDRDFTAAVDEGLKVFFSFNGDDFGRIARSPGFYANMVRTIVQSAGRIITDVVDAFQTLSGGNIVQGAQSIAGVIDVLRTSKVIAFLNIMAVLGDRSFARQDAGIDRAPRESVIDAIPDNEASHVMKMRTRGPDGQTTLAWRNSSPVSTLVMPSSFYRAATKLNRDPGAYLSKQDEMRHGVEVPHNPTGGRFSPEEVALVEKRLDAEYVPFYFQDLRTNEIIAFHAFINSVSEDFSPTYGESTPYGRIDPVMIYGNTRRSFALSFFAVSTSPQDFDAMYMKLNKLTTLLYPQWTRGRTVTNGENQFVQPFSQIPGSSPMCRIRLGNLMKSNFSNLALARLFDLGSDTFLDGQVQDTSTVEDFTVKARSTLRKQIQQFGWIPGQLATISPLGFKKINSRASFLPPALQSIQDEDVIQNFNRIRERSATVIIRSPGVKKKRYRNVEERVYEVQFREPGLDEVTITVPESALSINDEEVQKLLPALPELPGTTDPQRDFFKPENNSIVRSFQNTRGKGLAGFITSLNMGWQEADGNWDVERFSARAPQIVKLEIAFTVVHDIPPGLDADGFNRAPIYPVGDTMQETFGDVYDDAFAGRDEFRQQHGRIKGKV